MRISTTEELGEAIRHVRKHLGLTQADLALTAGTSVSFLVDLEKGKPTCEVGKTLTVAQSLGIHLQALNAELA